MVDAGLLSRERRGTWVWYAVNQAGLDKVRQIIG
jgi:ArsR family transcriptional regulator, arsenate/arsenite/antimonite-responsive transcriptional repressor